jgi:hypothetical protein
MVRLLATGAVLLTAGVASARGTCVVEGKHVAPIVIDVAPREATAFKLRVEGVPVQVETGGLEQPAVAHVRGALSFDGTVAAAEIPARTRRAVDALNGMVHLAQATEKLTLHGNVRGKVVDADVRVGGVELRGLTLPCDALTLDEVPSPKPSMDDDGSARFVPATKRLQFRGAPGGRGAAMEVAVEDPSALELKRVEEQGGWVRVTSRWADGTTLAGWVKRDELKPAGLRHERIGELSPVAAPVLGGGGACDEKPRTGANEKLATVNVPAGTQIFAARYLGQWARVVDGSKLQVRYRPKDDWVEIVTAPGIASVTRCATNQVLEDAWIPRTAAKLP